MTPKEKKAFVKKMKKAKEAKAKERKKSAKRTSRTVKTGKMKGWDVEITGTSYAKKSNPHPKEKGEIKRVEGGKVEVIETICHDWRGYLIDCETHKIIGEGYSHDPNWESLKDKDWRTV